MRLQVGVRDLGAGLFYGNQDGAFIPCLVTGGDGCGLGNGGVRHGQVFKFDR